MEIELGDTRKRQLVTADDRIYVYAVDANDRTTGETQYSNLTYNGTASQTTSITWNKTQQLTRAVVTPSVNTVTQSFAYDLTGKTSSITTETKNSSNTVTLVK